MGERAGYPQSFLVTPSITSRRTCALTCNAPAECNAAAAIICNARSVDLSKLSRRATRNKNCFRVQRFADGCVGSVGYEVVSVNAQGRVFPTTHEMCYYRQCVAPATAPS